MNYKWNKQNPIEFIRMTERLSQQDFGTKLGYPNKAQYCYNMREFTQDIIEKIKNTYGRDITNDIITYLKFKCRNLRKQIKQCTKDKEIHELSRKNKTQNISSIMDKVD